MSKTRSSDINHLGIRCAREILALQTETPLGELVQPARETDSANPMSRSISMKTDETRFLRLTSKMSHDGSWHDSCTVAPLEIASTAASTRRDRSRRWLWRLVRLTMHRKCGRK